MPSYSNESHSKREALRFAVTMAAEWWGGGSAAGWSTQLLPTPAFRGLESALVPNLAPFCRRFGGAGGQTRGPRVSVKSQPLPGLALSP